ncbi:MAG: hypothetical protein HXY19_07720 [Thermoanaerobaculaceae bacterium]|nr:hypothetical protein [Thermoanaerobaculaceae bacterium]
MVQFRPQDHEVIGKVVYYGPPLGGKTTNLRTLYEGYPSEVRGELKSVPTSGDRTIFFDFLPISIPGTKLRGMKLRVQLYTVPGQVHYNATRQIVLRGADAVVFVADSQRQLMRANQESWQNLKDNLLLQGLDLAEVPHVLQYNKRDLPDILPVEELDAALNEYNAPFFESVATVGVGVEETLHAVVRLMLRSLRERFNMPLEAPLTQPVVVPPPRSGTAPPPPSRQDEASAAAAALPEVTQRIVVPAVAVPRPEPDLASLLAAPAAPAPPEPRGPAESAAPQASGVGVSVEPFGEVPVAKPVVEPIFTVETAPPAQLSAAEAPFGELAGGEVAMPLAQDTAAKGAPPQASELPPAGAGPQELEFAREFLAPLEVAAPVGGELAGANGGEVEAVPFELAAYEAPAAPPPPPPPQGETVPAVSWEGEAPAPVTAYLEGEPFPLAEGPLPAPPAAAATEDVFALTPAPSYQAEPVPAAEPVERVVLGELQPRILAALGNVRELEIEIPVPARWIGGKRMTVQLRLTLVPQQEGDDE